MEAKKSAPAKKVVASKRSSKPASGSKLPLSFYDKKLEAEAHSAIKKGYGFPDF
jgi:hypothetical protein